MTKIYSFMLLCLLFTGIQVKAQTNFAAVQTKNSFIRLENDSAVLTPGANLRGAIQWQSSVDLITWVDEPSNRQGSVLAFKAKFTKAYRLKITEGECKPLYGDTIKIFAFNTSVKEYVNSGISLNDLAKAGVDISGFLPSIITSSISKITLNEAFGGGNVATEGASAVTARGVCWNYSGTPTISDNKTTNGSGKGAFTSNITGLSTNTKYFVRAYATNASGTSYGEEETFTTLSVAGSAEVTTSNVSKISQTSAACGGNVTSAGTSTVTERGVCWNTSSNPTVKNSKTTDGTGTGAFTSNITGLKENTNYYVRAYATSSVGTSYGAEKMFTTTSYMAPTVITSDVTSITQTTATCGGNVTSAGTSAVTARGICWNTSSGPTTANSKTSNGEGTGAFISSITGLEANTTYYIRAYATNAVGTSYSEEKIFATLAHIPPIVETIDISNIKETSAVSGGYVTSEGTLPVTERGICWGTDILPTIDKNKTTNGQGTGNFTSEITGLDVDVKYYVRAYATSAAGTSYGEEQSFTTQFINPAQIEDYDGNLYDTVTIGSQVWLKQNLKVTHYNNGDLIPLFRNKKTNEEGLRGYHEWNGYDSASFAPVYGAYYNYYAVVDSRNLCPAGWYVPSMDNWSTLFDYLGGMNSAGNKLKESGTEHWLSPNTGTNTTGFTALPGGQYGYDYKPGRTAQFLTSKGSNEQVMTYLIHPTSASGVYSWYATGKGAGNSVRCIKHKLPVVSTDTISNINTTSATCGGNVTSYDSPTTARGMCWSTKQSPTINDNHTSDGKGAGSFTSQITGLNALTKYYVRAYATNNSGTEYGAEKSFTTLATAPVVSTGNISYVGSTEIICSGNVTSQGGSQLTEKGVCWNTTGNPVIADSKQGISGTSTGVFTLNISSLTPGTKYYLRAYAKNSSNIAYGEEKTFTTKAVNELPVVSELSITDIGTNGARCSGNVTSLGAVTDHGVCWVKGNATIPTISGNKKSGGSGTGPFSVTLTGLEDYRYYNIRAYATNASDTAYGPVKHFVTLSSKPVVSYVTVKSFTQTTAKIETYLYTTGTAPLNNCGVCWSRSPNPTISDNKTVQTASEREYFDSDITGLEGGTTYYVRAYAINYYGISYGEQSEFTTVAMTVKDIDGNEYPLVKIGNQFWFQENLRTTKFNNGSEIPLVKDQSTWNNLTTPAYCWYNNDDSNKPRYGALYNWYTVQTDKLCPVGFHVSSGKEWKILIDYLGIIGAAGKMKYVSGYWSEPNEATNSSGFSAVGAGLRLKEGFSFIHEVGAWWTSESVYHSSISHLNADVYGKVAYGYEGCSVRCIMDN